MELHSDHDIRVTSSGGSLAKKGQAKKVSSPHHLKSPSHLNTNGKANMSPLNHKLKMTNGSTKGGSSVSFSTNSNSVVCLPLVSEGLKLVWTQSDQTKELDTIPELVQAFNVFPYPTSQEVGALAQVCGLPLDKVKVWFMVQRIKYGISWASEDIEETRCKLATPSELGHEEKKKRRKSGCDDLKEIEENYDGVDSVPSSPRKKQKKNPPELATYLTSPLSPQKNSVNSCPVDMPAAATPSAASSSSSALESTLRSPQKHGRYKKSKAQIAALRKSFLLENWPSEAELQRLQQETNLTRNEIRKWFSDSRYQLRTGRAIPGLIAPVSHEELEPPQLQPLSLVTEKQKSSVTVKGGARSKKAQKNLSRSSQFFQAFLSNTLEAFGEGDAEHSETEVAKEDDDDDIPNDDEEVESEHESEAPETEALSEAQSVSTSSSRKPKSSQSTVSKSLKKSPHASKAVGGRVRKTKEQLDILKEYFLRSPWPKGDDLTQLGELTTLPRADITQWFGDTRYAVKNGQLRWVSGNVRDHILSEIGAQQNSSGGAESSGASGTPKREGSRKRKSNGVSSASKVPKSGSDSSDKHPLEAYYQQTGALQEKDLDALCRKSKMSYQQVRDWFAAKDTETQDLEHSSTDD
ncbi:homeobox and leucine zipper protein Homez [Astyanax mexicanus]|uniref:Homeobox and leucine zipper protein Homez n=1 Tax=Astyanax mexicanus TaxID=7994 RepID=A0A8B9LP61_ASTMX|nr:homeobox and leucine zipper protein Homez [Astyanax mexicanus]